MNRAQASAHVLCALAEMSEVWPTVLADRLREGGERAEVQIGWEDSDPVRAWLLTKDADILSGRVSGVSEVLEFYLEWVLAMDADPETCLWTKEVHDSLALLGCPNCADRLVGDDAGCVCGEE
jgi:hypothetical protein